MKSATLALAGAAICFALPAHAWPWTHHDAYSRTDTGYHGRLAADDHNIHWAATNPADLDLALRIVDALKNDARLKDTTATVAVNGGRVALSGSAQSQVEAARVEQIASSIAGRANVGGQLDLMGA